MTYATQVRQRQSAILRKAQEDLIVILLQERKSVENPSLAKETTRCPEPRFSTCPTPAADPSISSAGPAQATKIASYLPTNELIPIGIGLYYLLVRSLLERIDHTSLLIPKEQRSRIRQVIVNFHEVEAKRIRSKWTSLGDRVCDHLFRAPNVDLSLKLDPSPCTVKFSRISGNVSKAWASLKLPGQLLSPRMRVENFMRPTRSKSGARLQFLGGPSRDNAPPASSSPSANIQQQRSDYSLCKTH